jgi:hypothetical protein
MAFPSSNTAIPAPVAPDSTHPSADEIVENSTAFRQIYAQFSDAKDAIVRATTFDARGLAIAQFVDLLVSASLLLNPLYFTSSF